MLTQVRLKQVLIYEPKTGNFYWAYGRQGVAAGSKAGTKNPNGYIYIGLDFMKYPAHQLAWLYIYGEMPMNEIDHINKIKDDNRIENLRDVEKVVNCLNKDIKRKGYYFDKRGRSKPWMAEVILNGNKIYLGAFITEKEAAEAVNDWSKNKDPYRHTRKYGG